MKLSYVEMTAERIAMLGFVAECLIDMGDERVVDVLNTICDPVDEDLIASCVPKLREMLAEAALAQPAQSDDKCPKCGAAWGWCGPGSCLSCDYRAPQQAQPCKHTYSEASAYCLGCNELRQAQPEMPTREMIADALYLTYDSSGDDTLGELLNKIADAVLALFAPKAAHEIVDAAIAEAGGDVRGIFVPKKTTLLPNCEHDLGWCHTHNRNISKCASISEHGCTCPRVPGRLHHYDDCPQAAKTKNP